MRDAAAWTAGPAGPVLGRYAAHVWWASLDVSRPREQELSTLLCAEEIERAGRFRFERDRRRYIAARGQLRELLALYTQTEPDVVRIRYNEYGKPSLDAPRGSLTFNLSHTDEIALIALTRESEIGVDIESVRDEIEAIAIGERMFSDEENRRLKSVAPSKQALAFCAIWTTKEAIVKMKGHGLFMATKGFTVDADLTGAGSGPVGLRSHGIPLDRARLFQLPHCDGRLAAVAIDGEAAQIETWRYR